MDSNQYEHGINTVQPIKIPPSLFFNTEPPPKGGSWILEYEAPGYGDTIDLVPLIHSLLMSEPSWNIVVRTNHFKIPFHLISNNVVAEDIFCESTHNEAHTSTRVNITESLNFPSYSPPWLRYFVTSGQPYIHFVQNPFPLLKLKANEVFAQRGLNVGVQYALHHRHNSRTGFAGRNTASQNHEYIAKRLENLGVDVIEVGNDLIASGNRWFVNDLSFAELFAISSGAIAFLGIDSFPMHVAALYRRPIFGFFGSTHPYNVLPCFGPVVVASQEQLACLNCLAYSKPRDLNQCIWREEKCGDILSADYLDRKFEDLQDLLNRKETIQDFYSRDNLVYLVRMAKSEFELLKALELAITHLPLKEGVNQRLRAVHSPNEFIERDENIRLFIQSKFQ